AQASVAIKMDQDRRILRRYAPLRGNCTHVVRMTGDVYLRVQSLHFKHLIVVHREMIIEGRNSSSNRTNYVLSGGGIADVKFRQDCKIYWIYRMTCAPSRRNVQDHQCLNCHPAQRFHAIASSAKLVRVEWVRCIGRRTPNSAAP